MQLQTDGDAAGDSAGWERLNDLFERLANASPGERALVLETELCDRPRLRTRLEAMFAVHDIGSAEVSRIVEIAFADFYLDRLEGQAGRTEQ